MSSGLPRVGLSANAPVTDRDITWFSMPDAAEWNFRAENRIYTPPAPATKRERRLQRRRAAIMGRIWAKYKREAA